MPYIKRTAGVISGFSTALQPDQPEEWVADDNAELLAYLNPQPTYQQRRAAEYPPMSDYLDAVVKNDPAQAQAYVDACLAVKARYPKG